MDYSPLSPNTIVQRQSQVDDRSLMGSIWATDYNSQQAVHKGRVGTGSIWAPQTPLAADHVFPPPPIIGLTPTTSAPTSTFPLLATPPDSTNRAHVNKLAVANGIGGANLHLGHEEEVVAATGWTRGLLWGPKTGNDISEGMRDGEDVFGKVKALGAIGDGRRWAAKPHINSAASDALDSFPPPRSPAAPMARPRSNTLPVFRASDVGEQQPAVNVYMSADMYGAQRAQRVYQDANVPVAHHQAGSVLNLQPSYDSLGLGYPAPIPPPMPVPPLSAPYLVPHGRSQSQSYMNHQWPTPPFTPSLQRQSQSSSFPSLHHQTPLNATPFGSTSILPPPTLSSALAWSQTPNAIASAGARAMAMDDGRVWSDPRWDRPASAELPRDMMGASESGWVSFGPERPSNLLSSSSASASAQLSDSTPTSTSAALSSSAASSFPRSLSSLSTTNVNVPYGHPTLYDSHMHVQQPTTTNTRTNTSSPLHITTSPTSSDTRHRTPTSHHTMWPPAVQQQPQQPINYLSYLQPASSPPYAYFCDRIARASDQQASIFLQQKLKVADAAERSKIIDAVVDKGFELMTNRFGNWAVQRCLEEPCTPAERARVVSVMRGRVVELSTSPYGTHVVQKALDGDENDKMMIVSELLLGDPGETLINKHASHVWSKIMELTWEGPAPPIFEYVNQSLRGKWAQLACHETGSLVAQHVFENLSEELKKPCVEEVLDNLSICAKNQWGSWVVQHIIEHGSPSARSRAIASLTSDLLSLANDQQGVKSLEKALKIGNPAVLDGFVTKMAGPRATGRRALIVDMALTASGSQLILGILPGLNRDQRNLLSEAIRSHVVTLKGSRTGARVIYQLSQQR